MKSLSIDEAVKYLGEDKFAVSLENAWYRRLLYPVESVEDRLHRIERYFDPDPMQCPSLFLAMSEWLPKGSHRLLWIDHIEEVFPSQKNHFLSVLDPNCRPDHLVENPAIVFGPFSDDIWDEEVGSYEQNLEAEALVTLCSLLTIGTWDAKLLTAGSTDYIEFWEGNVLFYSESVDSLKEANELLETYELKTHWA